MGCHDGWRVHVREWFPVIGSSPPRLFVVPALSVLYCLAEWKERRRKKKKTTSGSAVLTDVVTVKNSLSWRKKLSLHTPQSFSLTCWPLHVRYRWVMEKAVYFVYRQTGNCGAGYPIQLVTGRSLRLLRRHLVLLLAPYKEGSLKS